MNEPNDTTPETSQPDVGEWTARRRRACRESIASTLDDATTGAWEALMAKEMSGMLTALEAMTARADKAEADTERMYSQDEYKALGAHWRKQAAALRSRVEEAESLNDDRLGDIHALEFDVEHLEGKVEQAEARCARLESIIERVTSGTSSNTSALLQQKVEYERSLASLSDRAQLAEARAEKLEAQLRTKPDHEDWRAIRIQQAQAMADEYARQYGCHTNKSKIVDELKTILRILVAERQIRARETKRADAEEARCAELEADRQAWRDNYLKPVVDFMSESPEALIVTCRDGGIIIDNDGDCGDEAGLVDRSVFDALLKEGTIVYLDSTDPPVENSYELKGKETT